MSETHPSQLSNLYISQIKKKKKQKAKQKKISVNLTRR